MQETIKQNPSKKWYQKWWIVLIMILGGLILIFAGHVLYYYIQIKSGRMPLPSSAKFMRANVAATAPKQIDPKRVLSTGEPTSAPDAPLTIVGFFDFQCPFSREAYPTLRELQPLYDGKVNFVFRNFPLTEIHPQAMLAAQAGECAHLENKFWQMADKLSTNQNFSETDLKLYAAQIGLDPAKFSECLNSYQSKGQVLKDLLDGQILGVKGTPTWFINNETIEGAVPFNTFKKAIDYLLAQQQ